MKENLTDIVILTERRYVNPVASDRYTQNVLLEDNLVKKALENKGLRVKRLSWDDPDFNWATTKAVLFRTTWDYFDRFAEFSSWLNRVSKETQLINPEKLIRWNIDKYYLRDLEQKGTSIVPTCYIEKGSQITLQELIQDSESENFILKPCVSGGARHTYRIQSDTVSKYEAIFKKLIRNESMMLQPFMESIVKTGEISLMIIGGEYTHAVLKKAKSGDFRVQDDWGGTVHDYKPTPSEIDFAEKVVKNCPEKPFYARVDIAKDPEGEPLLVELELIEPELWFRKHPQAAELLADSIKKG